MNLPHTLDVCAGWVLLCAPQIPGQPATNFPCETVSYAQLEIIFFVFIARPVLPVHPDMVYQRNENREICFVDTHLYDLHAWNGLRYPIQHKEGLIMHEDIIHQ